MCAFISLVVVGLPLLWWLKVAHKQLGQLNVAQVGSFHSGTTLFFLAFFSWLDSVSQLEGYVCVFVRERERERERCVCERNCPVRPPLVSWKRDTKNAGRRRLTLRSSPTNREKESGRSRVGRFSFKLKQVGHLFCVSACVSACVCESADCVSFLA